jgi:membrane protease YdiL (CAAX protease family)
VFLIFFILQISEEFGWRGYTPDRLQARWSALISSLIIGVLWGIWHLPMFLSNGLPHFENHLPFGQLFITLVAASIFITWLQNNCKGSLIPAFVIHSLINISGEALPLIEKNKEVQGNYTA